VIACGGFERMLGGWLLACDATVTEKLCVLMPSRPSSTRIVTGLSRPD